MITVPGPTVPAASIENLRTFDIPLLLLASVENNYSVAVVFGKFVRHVHLVTNNKTRLNHNKGFTNLQFLHKWSCQKPFKRTTHVTFCDKGDMRDFRTFSTEAYAKPN